VRRVWIGVVLVAVASGAVADDLGQAAAREKERRRKLAAGAQSYTNDDLEKGKPAPSPTPTPNPTPAAPARSRPRAGRRAGGRAVPPPSPPPPAQQGRSEGGAEAPGTSESRAVGAAGAEADWRGRADALRAAASDAEKNIAALEARIAQLQLDRDPNPADQFDPNRLQKREAERGKAVEELTAARAGLAAARQALEGLREEARRKSVPPGWVD